MKNTGATLRFLIKAYMGGCVGCFGAASAVVAFVLLFALLFGLDGWQQVLVSFAPRNASPSAAPSSSRPNVMFTPASTPTGTLPSLQIWFTKENNPDSPAVTSFKLGELNQAFVWVKGPKGESVAFDLWMTMPDGGRERFGPPSHQFRTDPDGKPVNTGSGGPPPMRGAFKIEAVIGATTVGSTTITVP